MPRTDFSQFACSLAQSLGVLGDGWSPLILRDLYLGIETFDDLVDDLGLSRSLLTRRLSALVEARVVERVPSGEHRGRYRYRLTESGLELVPIFAALTAWGDRHLPPPWGQPLAFAHDGHACVPVVSCDHCGQPLSGHSLVPVAGPGARARRGTRILGAIASSDEPPRTRRTDRSQR